MRKALSHLWFAQHHQRSLRWKVTLAILICLLVILGPFTILDYQHHRTTMLAHLSVMASQSGQVIETNLRQQMLKSDFEGVQHLLDSIRESQGFQVVSILNTDGKVIFASQEKDVGQVLNEYRPDCLPCHSLPVSQMPNSVVVTTPDGQRVFRSMNLIQNGTACKQCHDPNQRLIGVLLTDISTSAAEASLKAELRESLIWWVVIILVTILVVNLVLDRLVLSRLEAFSTALQDFGQEQQPPQYFDRQPDEIGQMSDAFHQMAAQIETRRLENQALSENLQQQSEERGQLLKRLITAQENERARVARELHDEMGQALSGLSLQVEVIQKYLKEDPERAKEYLRQTQTLIHETTDCMYDLILALRPSLLDDLGLVTALRAHVERSFAGKGIAYNFDAGQLNSRLSPGVETALYRTFQEAINNVIHHSHATQVHIRLSQVDHCFHGEISDNGQGFDLEPLQHPASGRGLGLLGMRERITQWGGQLEILTQPGQGTKISVFIPISEAQNDRPDSSVDRG